MSPVRAWVCSMAVLLFKSDPLGSRRYRMRVLRRIAFASSFWFVSAFFSQAQSCLAPPPGLAHWWRAEGNGFDTISIQDGVLIGGVQFAPGKVGTGFSFSGSGDDY